MARSFGWLAFAPLAVACGQSEQRPTAPVASAPGPPVSAAAAPAKATPAAKPKADDGPRLYAKARFVWIKPEPGAEGWIGYLWSGGTVRLRSEKPIAAGGCQKWMAIEPRGYVCDDGIRATTDPKDPVVAVVQRYRARLDTPWPHDYGESRGLIRYPELPSAQQQRQKEWDLDQHLQHVAKAREGGTRHASLEGVELTPAPTRPIVLGALPATSHEPRSRLLPLSTVAYIDQARQGERSFLLSADLVWVPKDRVMRYEKVTFAGVKLGKDAKLPLAFFRGKDREKLRKAGDGFEPTGAHFARLSYVELTGKRQTVEDETYLETRDGDHWVREKDAVVPNPQDKTPWGAPVGGTDTEQGPEGRRSWIEASVWGGWLLAFEGTKPVYATMISPGRGGTPVPGKDPLETASTPTGSFKITGKFATATMEAPGEFIHSDVPWTQNFSGPHALHGAYWHNDWGNKKSAGCVNVSPIDGKWLYEFTEPAMPEGWHGVRWRPKAEPATTFVVHH